jgi:hypothetical protein
VKQAKYSISAIAQEEDGLIGIEWGFEDQSVAIQVATLLFSDKEYCRHRRIRGYIVHNDRMETNECSPVYRTPLRMWTTKEVGER